MTYKVGDKVRVKEYKELVDLAISEDEGFLFFPDKLVAFNPEMVKFCGKVLTISEVKNRIYKCKESGGWYFADYMLKPADIPLWREAAEELANEHWAYVKEVLKHDKISDDDLKVIGFHYITAFIHGFKHGIEYLTKD
jgi:hypothetical protein